MKIAVLSHQDPIEVMEAATAKQLQHIESPHSSLDLAIRSLRMAENVPADRKHEIAYVNLKHGLQRSSLGPVAEAVSKWALQHGFEGVVWKDLSVHKVEQLYRKSLSDDFAQRRQLVPSSKHPSTWYSERYFKAGKGIQGWGPSSRRLPAPELPKWVDQSRWRQDRIVKVVKHYAKQGLPYHKVYADGSSRRGHFPQLGYGLDCSNFASWVYNYGLGIHFSSSVNDLADPSYHPDEVISKEAILSGERSLQRGDLILLDGKPKHVVIYLGNGKIGDSTKWRDQGVGVNDLGSDFSKQDWRNPFVNQSRFLLVRRPLQVT